MNRRDFVKALAGVPLLGLLAKLPKAEEEWSLDIGDESAHMKWGVDTDSYVTLDEKSGLCIFDSDGVEVTRLREAYSQAREGRTIFVDLIAGDDANDGLSEEAPVTWDKGCRMTTHGTELHVVERIA